MQIFGYICTGQNFLGTLGRLDQWTMENNGMGHMSRWVIGTLGLWVVGPLKNYCYGKEHKNP